MFSAAYPQILYKINTDSWAIDKYYISSLGLNRDYDLNGDTGEISYSNYPAFFDVDSAVKYEESGVQVNLKVYDLNTEKQQLIATSIAKAFKPKWIDKDTLEYNEPNSEGRIQKIIK